MRFERPAPSDRRGDDGLIYDPAEGLLELGALSVVLAPGSGNPAVLDAYVDLAGRCRGDRLSALVDVRQSDLDALANALDLDAEDLTVQIEAALGASREEAVRLVTRLKEYRLIGGIAAAATGSAVAVALVVGASGAAGGATPPVRPVAQVAAPAAAASSAGTSATSTTIRPGPPVQETPDGAGLIDPITEGADGVGLVPAAHLDRPDPIDETPDGVGLVPAAHVDRSGATADSSGGVGLMPPASIERPPAS